MVEQRGAEGGTCALGPPKRQVVFRPGNAVLGVAQHVEAVIRGGGAVLAAFGRFENIRHHFLRGLEPIGGDRNGQSDCLDWGRVWWEVMELGDGGLTRVRKAGGFAGLLDLVQGGVGGGDGLGALVVVGGGGEREEESEGEKRGQHERGHEDEKEIGFGQGTWF